MKNLVASFKKEIAIVLEGTTLRDKARLALSFAFVAVTAVGFIQAAAHHIASIS